MLSSGSYFCISLKLFLKFIVANQSMNCLIKKKNVFFLTLYPYLLRGHINCHLHAQF